MAKGRKTPLEDQAEDAAVSTAAGSSVRPKRTSRPTAKAQSAEVVKPKKAGRPKKAAAVQEPLLAIDGTFLFFFSLTRLKLSLPFHRERVCYHTGR